MELGLGSVLSCIGVVGHMCQALSQRGEIAYKVGQIRILILAPPFPRHVILDKSQRSRA